MPKFVQPQIQCLMHPWPEGTPSSEEVRWVTEHDGIIHHESYRVIIDPETGERWALCWVRMPRRSDAG